MASNCASHKAARDQRVIAQVRYSRRTFCCATFLPRHGWRVEWKVWWQHIRECYELVRMIGVRPPELSILVLQRLQSMPFGQALFADSPPLGM